MTQAEAEHTAVAAGERSWLLPLLLLLLMVRLLAQGFRVEGCLSGEAEHSRQGRPPYPRWPAFRPEWYKMIGRSRGCQPARAGLPRRSAGPGSPCGPGWLLAGLGSYVVCNPQLLQLQLQPLPNLTQT